VVEPIGQEHPATADAIKTLVDAAVIKPDDALDAYMRTQYGLPVAQPEDNEEEPVQAPPAPPEPDQDDTPDGALGIDEVADPDDGPRPTSRTRNWFSRLLTRRHRPHPR